MISGAIIGSWGRAEQAFSVLVEREMKEMLARFSIGRVIALEMRTVGLGLDLGHATQLMPSIVRNQITHIPISPIRPRYFHWRFWCIYRALSWIQFSINYISEFNSSSLSPSSIKQSSI